MYALFGNVKPYLKPKPKAEVPRPDNLVFRLHYKLTFAIIGVACILVSTYSYIDKAEAPIQCLCDKGEEKIFGPILNRYCWIMSTFTLPKHFNSVPGEDVLHFGVGTHTEDDEKIYHAYYQWVPLVLALQAISFYAPHWIWKKWEGGRMTNIIVGLNQAIDDDNKRKIKVEQLAHYMKERSEYKFEHQFWAIKFFICELLNFINVVAQIFITNKFLGGEFTSYGTEVLNFPNIPPEDRVDPMSRIFPRMTKCTFHKYGGSGTIQKIDALCVLSMNIVNEKIYIFLWFWFIILAVTTGVFLIFRGAQFFLPNVRERLMQLQNLGYIESANYRRDAEFVVQSLSYSDWLILYYLAQCMEKKNFLALISKLAEEFSGIRRESSDIENQAKSFKDMDKDSEKSKRLSHGYATLPASKKFENEMYPMVDLPKE